jgi:predicted Zn-dependent protease
MAATYMHEGQWTQAVKQLEAAMQIHRAHPEYNLAMGECKLQLGSTKEAIQYFTNAVRARPKNIAGWEALIRSLYSVNYYEEALEQIVAAMTLTEKKPLFTYYLSAVYFAMGKSKEGLVQLQKAISMAPRMIKKFIELNPSILQNQQVVDLIASSKRTRKR